MRAEELLPTPIPAARFLAVHKLGRPRPREGKGKIAPRVRTQLGIEGQEGQLQVARVGDVLSAAQRRLKIEASD